MSAHGLLDDLLDQHRSTVALGSPENPVPPQRVCLSIFGEPNGTVGRPDTPTEQRGQHMATIRSSVQMMFHGDDPLEGVAVAGRVSGGHVLVTVDKGWASDITFSGEPAHVVEVCRRLHAAAVKAAADAALAGARDRLRRDCAEVQAQVTS